jgi:hypothetical protein
MASLGQCKPGGQGVSQTRDFKVRGYMIVNAAGYLREAVQKESGEPGALRAIDKLSPEVRKALSEAKSAEWYPVSHLSEVFRAIAALGNGDEERARQYLVAAGSYNAREATNTFLRLLMRMLTPTIFARKVPDFWRRDCTQGRLEVNVSDNKFTCHVYDMEGFDHAIVGTVGYLSFAFEAMGKRVQHASLHGWSLSKPSADGAWMELRWAD